MFTRRLHLDSIRIRLLLAVLVTGLMPVAILFLASKHYIGHVIVEAEYDNLAGLADELSRQVESVVEGAFNDLGALASSPALINPDVPIDEKKREFTRLTEHYEHFYDITLLDRYGFAVVSSNADYAGIRDQTSWFDTALSGETFVSRPEVFQWESETLADKLRLFFTVYIPIEQGDRVEFVAKGRVRFDKIWNILDAVRVGETTSFVLIDDFGNLLSHGQKHRILSKYDSRVQTERDVSGLILNNRGIYLGEDGEESIIVTKTIHPVASDLSREWHILGQKSKGEVTTPMKQIANNYLLGGMITLLIALLLGSFLAQRLTSPIVQASLAAKRVSGGELDVRIPEDGSAENRDLAESFNQMIDEVREHRFELELLVDSRTRRLKRSQQDLEDLSAQLKAAYDSVQEGIAVIRNDGTIITANENLREFFGLHDDPTALTPGDFRKHLIECFEDGSKFSKSWSRAATNPEAIIERELDLKQPQARNLGVYSAPVWNKSNKVIARVWMFRDITEQKQLQLSLQQAQKMEAIGRLAGGVAHDFNNLLTGIIGNLQLAQMGNSASGQEGQFIESAKKAGQRAAELVKQLLGFSRRTHLELQQTDVNEVISDVENLLTASLDPSIQIEVDAESDLWGVKIDPTQMEQVIMNMCVNAKDAMKGGGSLRLKTGNHTLSDEEAVAMPGGRPGEYVVISVEDSGEGIPPEVMEKIFEPFFTTKEQGKGTGLGLATSYGIVQQHGGWIDCKSVPGEGTTFLIYLPRQENSAKPQSVKTREQDVKGGKETLLLVDDEAVVRAVAEGALRHHGYTIVTASDGQEALEILGAEGGEEIKLVLLDLTMPRLSGRETLKGIRADYGDLPVVVCSGFLVDLDGFEEETGLRANGFVQKPYNLKSLAGKVRNVLDGVTEPRAVSV